MSRTKRDEWQTALDATYAAELQSSERDPMVIARAHAARNVQTAQRAAERAVAYVQETAGYVAERLERDGAGALTGGIGFEQATRDLADALLTLKLTREMFGLLLSASTSKKVST